MKSNILRMEVNKMIGNIENTGKIKFYRRSDDNEYVIVKNGEDKIFKFEIPSNYEQWHIDNIIRDFNNGKRTLIFKWG